MTAPVAGPVLVVGSGLLGASIGLALRRAGVQVWLDDVDADAVAEAVERGAGETWQPGAGEPRLVVVAVPPAAAGAAMAKAGVSSRSPRKARPTVTCPRSMARAISSASRR